MHAPPAQLLPEYTVVVLVDYQERLVPAIEGGEAACASAVRLAMIARLLNIPVIGTEQSPAKLGQTVPQLRSLYDVTVPKTTFDACGAGLLDHLIRDGHRVRDVVMAGCETHICLMSTAMALLREAFGVRVVVNACGSRAAGDHELALSRMRHAGIDVLALESVAFELMADSEHNRFRELQALVK